MGLLLDTLLISCSGWKCPATALTVCANRYVQRPTKTVCSQIRQIGSRLEWHASVPFDSELVMSKLPILLSYVLMVIAHKVYITLRIYISTPVQRKYFIM